MTYSKEQLLSIVPPIVAESLGLVDPLELDQTFESVDADSIDLATLAIGIAEEFEQNINVDDMDLNEIKSTINIIDFLLLEQSKKEADSP